jgi:hypothetical protein
VAEYRGVTDTREKYDEHEASDFEVILDEDEGDEDDGPTAEEVARDEAIKTAVRLCEPWDEDAGLSYSDAAGYVDYSASWVGDRVREWSGGDHRDLVAAPEGGSA